MNNFLLTRKIYRENLYGSVNYLSSIKFRINTSVLEYIKYTDNKELLNELFKGKSSLLILIYVQIDLVYASAGKECKIFTYA